MNSNKKTGKYGRKTNKKKRKIVRWPVTVLAVIFILIYGMLTMGRKISEERIERENFEKNSFISKIEKTAVNEYSKSGILPSITISQAILESNWGTSKLATEGNNLFGIKADRSWNGDRINFNTKENYDDYVYADFRKYSSWEESVIDYTNFLKKNKRYEKHGMFETRNYEKQAKSLEDAGYATAENENGEKVYAERLIRIIEKYNLKKYDVEAINNKY